MYVGFFAIHLKHIAETKEYTEKSTKINFLSDIFQLVPL